MLAGERGREGEGAPVGTSCGGWAAGPGGAGPGARAEAAPSLCRVRVRLVPAVRDPHWAAFLQQLRVDWPAAPERVGASAEALRRRALAEVTPAGDPGALPAGALGSVSLKELAGGRGRAAGSDPRLDRCLGRTCGRAGPGGAGRGGPWRPLAPCLSPRSDRGPALRAG